MSLINKMLQDLDKRHAADSGGGLTQQLRPVRASKDWRRIMWEVGAGLLIGAGWTAWVSYQISPRSVVTDLAFQLQAKRARLAAGPQAPAEPRVRPPLPTPPAPVAVPAAPPQPVVAAAPAAAPAAPTAPQSAAQPAAAAKVDILKLATEIETPFKAKRTQPEAAPRTKPKGARASAPARASAAPNEPSIDKRLHLPTAAERADDAYRAATALLNQGRVAEAIDGYEAALQHDPAHAAARQALVGLLLEHRRLDEAQKLLQNGLRLYPDRYGYAILLARIQVEHGDLEAAHQLLAKYARLAAGDAEYHAFDAALLQRLGRHKDAVSGYEAALKLAPQTGLWWMGLAISLQADQRDAEALAAFRRAKAAGGLSPALLAFVDQRIKQLQ